VAAYRTSLCPLRLIDIISKQNLAADNRSCLTNRLARGRRPLSF
jgi:hypothetical protein